MITCSYCGRENGDDAVRCRECGSSLVPEPTPEHKEWRKLLGALIQKRDTKGCWIYLLWLVVCYTVTFVVFWIRAWSGVDYRSGFVWLLICTIIGFVQFRAPTILGWIVLFVPTVIVGLVFIIATPSAVADAISVHDIRRELDYIFVFIGVTSAVLLFGFVYYRPFWRRHAASEDGSRVKG